MFKNYTSKPTIRSAHLIQETDEILHDPSNPNTSHIVVNGEHITFKHHEPVKTGDYVVRLTPEDTYHCNAEVFAERNHLDKDTYNFGEATDLARKGHTLARQGWNGKDMQLFLVPNHPTYAPHWILKHPDGKHNMWSPSTSDSLAEDWIILD